MTASTKGHGSVLKKSTLKQGAPGRTQPQSWIIGSYGSCHYVQPSASLLGIEKLVLFGNNRPFHRPVLNPSHPNPSSKYIYCGKEAGSAWPSSSTEIKTWQARQCLQLSALCPSLDLFEVFMCAGAVETQHCPRSIFITWIPPICASLEKLTREFSAQAKHQLHRPEKQPPLQHKHTGFTKQQHFGCPSPAEINIIYLCSQVSRSIFGM